MSLLGSLVLHEVLAKLLMYLTLNRPGYSRHPLGS